MSIFDKFSDWNKEEEKVSGYPIIWKREPCMSGECKSERTSHRWSVPFGTAIGLTTECYDCHKTRAVKVSSDPNLWINNEGPSEFVKQREKELQERT